MSVDVNRFESRWGYTDYRPLTCGDRRSTGRLRTRLNRVSTIVSESESIVNGSEGVPKVSESAREDLAVVIEAHAETTVDMGTPRKYTGHGGWNISCKCGHLYGSQEEVDAGYSAHIADAVLVTLAAHDDRIRAAALAPVLALADDSCALAAQVLDIIEQVR